MKRILTSLLLIALAFSASAQIRGYNIVVSVTPDHQDWNYRTGEKARFVVNVRKSGTLLPNTTEACMLTGLPWQENMSEAQVDALLDRLQEICPTVILTGVGFREGFTGVMVAQDGERRHYEHRKMPHGRHGTGDIYSSAFTGALLRGLSAYDAAVIAADYTLACIERTQDDPDHWYGVKFELALPDYIRMLGH